MNIKRGDLAFAAGVFVTALTTLAHPGGLMSSIVVGTCAGTVAIGVVSLLLDKRS